MKTKEFTANDVFVSTGHGIVLALLEWGIAATLVTLIICTIFSYFPLQPPFLFFKLCTLVGCIGIASLIFSGWPKSLVVWRFFKTTDAQIEDYKQKKIAYYHDKIKANSKTIELLQKENIEMGREIIALS